jgi:hypothetical protein
MIENKIYQYTLSYYCSSYLIKSRYVIKLDVAAAVERWWHTVVVQTLLAAYSCWHG